MVCGNMEVEATPETFMDDLYDSKEDKVGELNVNSKVSVFVNINYYHNMYLDLFFFKFSYEPWQHAS